MHPNAKDNRRRENHHERILESLEAKIRKLQRRSDHAAEFARSHLVTWREQLRARLEAWRATVPDYEPAQRELADAQSALDAKRIELETAMREALAPLQRRVNEAGKALETAIKSSTLSDPHYPGMCCANPGDTDSIAELAFKEQAHIHTNRISCLELALNQRHISAPEMVMAIVAEADAMTEVGECTTARETFARRWRAWASQNGVDPGPLDSPPPQSSAVSAVLDVGRTVVEHALRAVR